MVTNRKGLLSFDDHLYNFLSTINFPKILISNKQIQKKFKEHSATPSPPTLKEEDEDFKSILENTSTPSAHIDLMTSVVATQK
jgi:hypothetical protein